MASWIGDKVNTLSPNQLAIFDDLWALNGSLLSVIWENRGQSLYTDGCERNAKMLMPMAFLYIHGGPKKFGILCCTPYNFIKYWPIFKLVSLWESGEHM